MLLYVPTVSRGNSKKLCIRWRGSGHGYLTKIAGTSTESDEREWVHETRVQEWNEATDTKVSSVPMGRIVMETMGTHIEIIRIQLFSDVLFWRRYGGIRGFGGLRGMVETICPLRGAIMRTVCFDLSSDRTPIKGNCSEIIRKS